jgi:hypothetical protein
MELAQQTIVIGLAEGGPGPPHDLDVGV